MIGDVVLRTLERVCNEVLSADSTLAAPLEELRGRVISLRVLALETTVYVIPHSAGVHLAREWHGSVDVSMVGTPLALLSLLQEREGQSGVGGGVDIQGDLAVLQQLQRIARQADIDWELLLSRHVGDVAAYALGRGTRHMARLLDTARRSLEMNISEYLHHESDVLAQRDEVRVFVHSVDELRMHVDRLAQRIADLERKVRAR